MTQKIPLLVLLIALFVLSVFQLDRWPSRPVSSEMVVALPKLVQVLFAGGDRYLAANLGGIRALVADTQNMNQDQFRILARVQEDVAWLNPAHEDNYYIASAILPWNGQLDAAQFVLHQAIDARPFDMWPSFYFAFHIYHFKQDPLTAAEWLRFGSTRTMDEHESLLLNDIASRWVRNGTDRKSAIGILTAMANAARSGGFSAHLRKHVKRLENLLLLEDAAKRFQGRYGRMPESIELLLSESLIEGGHPVDPFGARYLLKADGSATVQEYQ